MEYYCKLPGDIAERDLIIVDPMLATRRYPGPAPPSISSRNGEGAANIRYMGLIAAPEGLERVQQQHPDVGNLCGLLWMNALNEHATSSPALGDAGDRLFGTK